VEREAPLVDERSQRHVPPRQRDRQLDLIPGVARQRLSEPGQLDEPEALGKREVLVEQAIAAERAGRVGNQRLVPGEPRWLDRLAPQPLEPRQGTGRRADEHAEAATDDELVELQGHLVAASEEHVQAIHGDLLERVRRRRAEPKAQDGLHRFDEPERVERKVRRERRVARLGDLDGPQRHVMGRTELTGRHLPARYLAAQHRTPVNHEPGGQRALGHGGHELDDRHRRCRRQIVRIHDLEKVLGEARELGIQLEPDAGREEAESLEQPLDVRIRDFGGIERQPRGDLGKRGCELGPHLPHVLQLLAVVAQHARVHQRPSAMRISPLSRSMSVLIRRSSGYG
jgi:hypothetical protein